MVLALHPGCRQLQYMEKMSDSPDEVRFVGRLRKCSLVVARWEGGGGGGPLVFWEMGAGETFHLPTASLIQKSPYLPKLVDI